MFRKLFEILFGRKTSTTQDHVSTGASETYYADHSNSTASPDPFSPLYHQPVITTDDMNDTQENGNEDSFDTGSDGGDYDSSDPGGDSASGDWD